MLVAGSPITVLTELPRWVAWRNEDRKNKLAKIPYTPGTDRWAARTDKPETWASYEAAAGMKGCDGPGFVLTGLPELAAIDLDGCRDAQTGRIEPWAVAICQRAQSYTELSPSGRGVHVLGLAQGLPPTTVTLPQGDGGQQCEVYCGGTVRYLTVSWERLEEYPGELNDIGPLVRELLAEAEGGKRAKDRVDNIKSKPNGAESLLLVKLPNDYDRAGWIKYAMAHKASGGDFETFDLWSAKHPSYDAYETARVWQSLKPNGTITGATIKHEARKHGIESGATPAKKLIKTSAEFVRGFVPPDYLIDGLLQRRFIYSLTGTTGGGKTAVLLLAAYCTAVKTLFGGHEIEGGRVIYFAGENPDDVRQRWIAMAEHIGFDVNAINVHFVEGVISLEQLEEQLRAEIAETGDDGATLIIIDTSASYFEGIDENSNPIMGAYARRLRRFTTFPGGPTVLVACHPIKNAGPDNLLPRGGGAFLAEVDGNLTASRSDTVVTLHWLGKFRGADFDPISLEFRNVTAEKLTDRKGRAIRTVMAADLTEAQVSEKKRAGRDEENEVLILMASAEEGPPSLAAIAEHLSVSRSRAQRVMGRLKKDKLVTNERGESYALTSKGKAEAKKAQYNRAAAGGTYGCAK